MFRFNHWNLLRGVAFFTIGSTMALLGVSVINVSASPATLSFTSSNPSTTSTKQATVSFTIKTSQKDKPWSISVNSSASAFTNCASVPVSAVSVQCSSVSVSAGTGACMSSFPLSTSPTQLAGGLQATADQNYTVLINYVLTDAWRYPGANSPSCSLTLDYTVSADK